MVRRIHGSDVPELLTEYAGYLAARPGITLDTILEDNSPDRGWNVAAAVVVDLLNERGGTDGIRRLLGCPPGDYVGPILEDNSPDRGWNVAAAVVVENERGGTEAVFGAGRANEELRLALSDALGMPWERVLAAWRESVLRAGRPEP